jgi:hypothetical protein
MLTIIPHPDAVRGKPAVEAVQTQLIAAGFSCGPHGADGVPGKDTRAAWSKWWGWRVRHLDASNPHHRALRIALRDACDLVRRGTKRLDELLAVAGGVASSAHCAYACEGWYREAAAELGLRLVSPSTSGVVRWWHSLPASDRIPVADVREGRVALTPGMMFFRVRKVETLASALRGGTPYGHCGLVEKLDGGAIWTVQANTLATDSAVGGKVVAKTEPLDDPRLLGFARARFERPIS